MARFFTADDWYTDADSNAYQLPTFLGNHDMGRFAHFLRADNPGADDAELLRRDVLAHELMYLSRGTRSSTTATSRASPARAATSWRARPCSPARCRSTPTTPSSAPTAPAATTTSSPTTRSTRPSRGSTRSPRSTPLRDGALQVRHADDGPGVVAFSRTDAREQVEYVVAVNNSTEARTAAVPTYAARAGFRLVHGDGRPTW